MVNDNCIDSNTLGNLHARINRLNPESKAKWGTMNVTQMLTHLNDALRIALGMKEAKDRSNFFTRVFLFPLATYILPVWPKNSATAPEMQQGKKGSPPRDFYTEAEFLKKLLDVFNEREEAKLKPHPMFGKLNKKQWRDLLIKHLNHHLNQFGV